MKKNVKVSEGWWESRIRRVRRESKEGLVINEEKEVKKELTRRLFSPCL